jgi:hypothetical protein
MLTWSKNTNLPGNAAFFETLPGPAGEPALKAGWWAVQRVRAIKKAGPSPRETRRASFAPPGTGAEERLRGLGWME